MSIFWDRKTYTSFMHRVGTKWKPFEKASWRYYPTPGCISHRKIVGERRGEILFRGFFDRPQKAARLYWKSHPDEYKKLMESLKT